MQLWRAALATAASAALASPAAAAPAAPLTIHLHIEDGRGHFDAYSDLLHALTARGHEPTLFAPARCQSWVEGARVERAAACATVLSGLERGVLSLVDAVEALRWSIPPSFLLSLDNAAGRSAAQAACAAAASRLRFHSLGPVDHGTYHAELNSFSRGSNDLNRVDKLWDIVVGMHAAWTAEAAAAYAPGGPLRLPDVLLTDTSKFTGHELMEAFQLRNRTVRLAPASSAALFDRPAWLPSFAGGSTASSGTIDRLLRRVWAWGAQVALSRLWRRIEGTRPSVFAVAGPAVDVTAMPPLDTLSQSWAQPPPVLVQLPWGWEPSHAAWPAVSERIGPTRDWALRRAVRAVESAPGGVWGAATASSCGTPTGGCDAIKSWLDAALEERRSVVYVSLGTSVAADTALLTTFATGLGLLNATNSDEDGGGTAVLWAVSNATLATSLRSYLASAARLPPQRLLVASFTPQEAVLHHPSITAFVTHGGLNSVLQSLDAGVSMLCTGLAFDQPENCRAVAERGAGVVVDVEAVPGGDTGLAVAVADGLARLRRPAALRRYRHGAAFWGEVARTAGGIPRAVEVIERTAAVGTSYLTGPADPAVGDGSSGTVYRLSFLQRTFLDAYVLLAALVATAVYGMYRAAAAAAARCGCTVRHGEIRVSAHAKTA